MKCRSLENKSNEIFTKSIVLNQLFIFANMFLSFPASTTTQSFSTDILDPTDARFEMTDKKMTDQGNRKTWN